jgi:hypothetical protein
MARLGGAAAAAVTMDAAVAVAARIRTAAVRCRRRAPGRWLVGFIGVTFPWEVIGFASSFARPGSRKGLEVIRRQGPSVAGVPEGGPWIQ